MNYEFKEKAPLGVVMKAVFAGLFILLCVLLVLSQAIIPSPLSTVKTLTLVILLISITVIWMMFDMHFGANAKQIFIQTGPFSYRIRKNEIEKAFILKKIPFWAGWGIRLWWWDGLTLAFVSEHKPSLYVVKKTGLFKRVVFSVSEPEKFAKNAGLKLSS
ncbi:MAG: hypothetical protein V1717_04545 [Candidatus Micrarchaeota archaeon]